MLCSAGLMCLIRVCCFDAEMTHSCSPRVKSRIRRDFLGQIFFPHFFMSKTNCRGQAQLYNGTNHLEQILSTEQLVSATICNRACQKQIAALFLKQPSTSVLFVGGPKLRHLQIHAAPSSIALRTSARMQPHWVGL